MSFKTKQTLYNGEYLSQNGILKELIKQKIVGIEQIGNDFYLCELCDEYYKHKLTKQDCIELSKFFKELYCEVK